MFYRALYCFFFLQRNFSRNELESLFLLGKKRRKTCVTRKRKSSRLSLLGIHFSVIIFYHVYLYYSYNVYCPTKYRSLTYFKVPLISLTALTLLLRSLLRVLCTCITDNNLLPHTFNTTFVTNRQVHTYNTWNANNYRPYFCRRNIKQFTILHLGPKLWNSLPHNLTELTSYSSFKTSFKKYLIERALN